MKETQRSSHTAGSDKPAEVGGAVSPEPPAAEPVAWLWTGHNGNLQAFVTKPPPSMLADPQCTPLYRAVPAPAGLHKLPVSFLVEEPGDSDHQTESSAQAVQRAAIDLLRMAVAHIDNLEGCLEDLASLGATVAICGSTYDRAAINTVLEKS